MLCVITDSAGLDGSEGDDDTAEVPELYLEPGNSYTRRQSGKYQHYRKPVRVTLVYYSSE